MTYNGSASATERTIECPASLVFPRAKRSSKYAESGQAKHAFVRAVLAGAPLNVALAGVGPKDRATCENLQWHSLIGDLQSVRCEAAYALDPIARTARYLGTNVGRNYAQFNLGPDEIPGTIDLEGETYGGRAVVADLKSGFMDVTDAVDNGQLHFAATVRHLVTGASEVEGRIEKLRIDGSVYTESRTVYVTFDFDVFLDEMAHALEESRRARRVFFSGGTPDVSVGPWCRYCEAMEACPAYTSLARSMVADTYKLESAVGILTREQAGAAWKKAKQIETMLKRVIETIKDRARQENLPIEGTGKCVSEISFERSDLDVPAALALLREKGATPEEIAGLQHTTTVRQVREVNDPTAAPKPKRVRKLSKNAAAEPSAESIASELAADPVALDRLGVIDELFRLEENIVLNREESGQ